MDRQPPFDIVLASASPRRRELMAKVAPSFRVFPVDVDEASVAESDPVRFAVEAAALKAKKGGEAFPASVVIGADTVVALNLRILGKPADRDSARAMLRSLSGRRHRVITGIALYQKIEDRLLTGYELTYVTFRPLTDEMIEGYLDRNEYLDKAGAYAVQDIGDAFVERMKGDFDNVVGFPTPKVRRLLSLFAVAARTVTVEDLDWPGGSGMATVDGRTWLVPGGVPGDRARVQVVGDRDRARVAEVLGLEAPSPRRAAPACPRFGTCGGCLTQHLDYATQLELKGRHLEKILRGAALLAAGDTLPPVTPSPRIYHYRNKMEYSFGERDGRLVLGLRERVTARRQTYRRTLGLETCPIFSPVIETVFPVVLDFAEALGLRAFEPATGRGHLRHLVLREAERTGELMAVLTTAGLTDESVAELAGRLAQAVPRLKSFVHAVSDRRSDVVELTDMRLLAGEPFIDEQAAGLIFRVHPATFFQTNTGAAELLYERIRRAVPLNPDSRVLGLYCGSGPIELVLAGAAGEVTAIDSSPDNIANAVENAILNGIENARFVPGTVEALLAGPQKEPADVLILDPPRPGLTPKALRRVLPLAVPTVVYVSCNPEALARDLKEFVAAGYAIGTIVPFDLFPHTPHLETLAVLGKSPGR
jgi:23S rRNA (uracil-5-)-methyltransferase RumA/MAF protein